MPYKDPEKQKGYLEKWKKDNRSYYNAYHRWYRAKKKMNEKIGDAKFDFEIKMYHEKKVEKKAKKILALKPDRVQE